MHNTIQKMHHHEHHDNDNSNFWGTPNSAKTDDVINVIVDISNPVRILNCMIAESIFEGEHCEQLRNDVIRLTCMSLFCYINQDNSYMGTTNENTNKAIQCLMDYQLNPDLALKIFHETETSLIKALLNVIPDIDDEEKHKIIKYDIISGNGLCLTFKVQT